MGALFNAGLALCHLCTLVIAKLQILGLEQHVHIALAWYRSSLEKDLVVFHHADHGIVVRSRVDQVCRSYRERTEYVGTDRDSDIIGRHSVLRLVLDYLSHELYNKFEGVTVQGW